MVQRAVEGGKNYELTANPEYLNFKSVKIATVDESKPWKPALTVDVIKVDGAVAEGIDANTPFFKLTDKNGKEILVSAATAGHIQDLHINGTDLGSKFDEPDLQSLFQDVASHMPEGQADREGIFTFDMDMGKSMGSEGLASFAELMNDGVLEEKDIALAQEFKAEVQALNRESDQEKMRAFVAGYAASHPEALVQFVLIRGDRAIVPQVKAPKRPTTKLFVMMGPDASGSKPSIYTLAPGRDMPRHPIAGQHTTAQGVFSEATFQQSADVWFNTVMLAG